jgi:hypothetical protein
MDRPDGGELMATQKWECPSCKECFEEEKPVDVDAVPCPRCGESAKPVRTASRGGPRGYGMVIGFGGDKRKRGGG